MSTALATQNGPIDAAVVENVLLKGDLRQLNPAQKIAYYNNVCASLGLNPLTQPFAYINLNGKEVLYAKKDATEQLRKIHNISIAIPAREVIEGVYVVTARASMPTGRQDESTGAVTIDGLKGENRANAMLKAETKAKRRVTLSICGMGMLDENEVEDIPGARHPLVVEAPKADRPALAAGEFYILKAEPREFGGVMTVVDHEGAEAVYPVPDRQCVDLAIAIVQEGGPVRLDRVKGPRNGVVKVKAIHRVSTPTEAPDAPLAITADDIAF
jgi:hypothetical protein